MGFTWTQWFIGYSNPFGLTQLFINGQSGIYQQYQGDNNLDCSIIFYSSDLLLLHMIQYIKSKKPIIINGNPQQRKPLVLLNLHEQLLQSQVSEGKQQQQLPQYILQHLSLIHISEPTRLGMISYAVFCLKKKKKRKFPLHDTTKPNKPNNRHSL
eukprot:TRINITY_DN25431_c0_g1_i1.p2 TRINITY_DN25431_c0_g1~~TRINITY_DN25431_c0_g1_i1.p2  ORF type:complete len:155 (-),score=15.61 TRINITY_DN25431_c0_g1_i1:23-487(-)